ncbi:putative two component, sigma54 specific, transcriptional regulator [Desulfovibrio sp. X2]|uniref:sigma-54-dependent transcriptional regulator n=1 Tax=Desulfovibrio sp. X2 TaxID=941449 RepID=UPI00035888F2|nr:sigma-54 dependent transcriptional regulator [Desulfovibrio sp. X2]EPR39887.1 putative two component, sigma54 specific, transcriptional regulator [Desulfovibrio sp. X2]
MANILVIDDDERILETMRRIIERMHHTALVAPTLALGLAEVEHGGVDVVFLDISLPDGNGLDALPRIKSLPGAPEVIILTGQGDPDGAELAIQEGVWDYLVKPTPIRDTMLSLERALLYRQEKMAAQPPVEVDLEGVVGLSQRMKSCYEEIARAAHTNASVLITGETGTGKELFARTIHANSERKDGPFVVIDCASLTENLVESALFGHKKGSFTGASADRTGLVALANTGTLFLDEVGEMSLALQKSFLRVLQERRFRPVGGMREEASDFRLIAATNRDLEAMVEEGAFRQDLYFRLKTFVISLPPLRERTADVKLLTMYKISALCEQNSLPAKRYDPEFFQALAAYPWPGNVRELFAVLETAFHAAGGTEILYARHLPQEVRVALARANIAKGRHGEAGQALPRDDNGFGARPGAVDTSLPLRVFKDEMERRYLKALARETNGDVDAMIERSGVSKSHLYALLKKAGISPGHL